MIRSADVRTDAEARSWEARLNRERPQRHEVAGWIASKINANSAASPRVVELACGAGFLAEFLKRHLPDVRYCGFDLSPNLLDFAQRRLGDTSNERGEGSDLHFVRANLVSDDWTPQLAEMGWSGKVDAVVSIQALHDLGDLAQQKYVLTKARGLLRPGGLLAYGDLLLETDNPHPSRYSRADHEEMLRACGFSLPESTTAENLSDGPGSRGYAAAAFGDFGTFACRK